MRTISLILLALLLVLAGQAQEEHSCVAGKRNAFNSLNKKTRAGRFDNSLMSRYDVHWYFLDLNVERDTTYISGSATIGANILVTTDTFCFELNHNLIIDSIVYENERLSFLHMPSSPICYALAKRTWQKGDDAYLKIFYHGDAGDFVGRSHDGFLSATGTGGSKVTWSKSEPYSAREWFPCKQFLQDKADSSWVNVTTNEENKVASNGKLEGVDKLPNNKVRYRWRSNYRINYYLISVAVAQYTDYTTFAYPKGGATDSIKIVNYLYDDSDYLKEVKPLIDSTAMLIEYFSEILGMYPYSKEKYGHASAPMGGAMEHQTMSTMGYYSFGLIAHELMHQWFGNHVTCATWSDIFINEGFATYGAYMAFEKFYEPAQAANYMAEAHARILNKPFGTIYVPDTTNAYRIFDYTLTYKKGSAVIHSLRFVLGDSVFFQSLRNFLLEYGNGNASIVDFKKSMEQSSGQDLTAFFEQWFYGEGFPVYQASYYSDTTHLYLKIDHYGLATSTPTFITPLEILCKGTNNEDTVIRVDIRSNSDTIIIPMCKAITGIELDPNNWIINKSNPILEDTSLAVLKPSQGLFEDMIKVFPNPTDGLITIQNLGEYDLDYELYNVTGKLINSFYSKECIQSIDISSYSNGMYILQIRNSAGKMIKKIIKQ